MYRRKPTLEIDIDDDAVNSIRDLEREILARRFMKNRQPWVYKNMEIMVNTICQIIV